MALPLARPLSSTTAGTHTGDRDLSLGLSPAFWWWRSGTNTVATMLEIDWDNALPISSRGPSTGCSRAGWDVDTSESTTHVNNYAGKSSKLPLEEKSYLFKPMIHYLLEGFDRFVCVIKTNKTTTIIEITKLCICCIN